jgi:eukaryotic-like serine/threonine-protein kinase
MDKARSEQVTAVLQAALRKELGARAEFIATACGGDEELRREVESLLATRDRTGTLAETPNLETAGLPVEARGEAVVGHRIGPYEVVGEIGRGGMGAVYRAVRADVHYRKQVAIKLIRGGGGSDLVLRRFVHERQILANLDHPNIARLLDGGATADGSPYLVMEHIEGRRLDEYCDAARLGLPPRLALFRQVCAAVHYAHQNLVVHRDIKPGNILVTAEGVPKLLDFGIAKLLAPDLSSAAAEMTAVDQRVMTPDYASPEQVRGDPITTASDVYSLGVLLYELLSGRRPYYVGTLTLREMEKVVCEREPPPPSAALEGESAVPGVPSPDAIGRARDSPPHRLRRALMGDLDNIVLKALRKEPARRYASVEQLSEDVLRYLEARPVGARPDTVGYRAAKFVRRHKAGVAAAALVVLSLVGGIVATTHQARVARSERSRAERRFGDVRRLANSLMFELHDAIQNLEGATPARALLVKRASEYLDSLAAESGGDASLQRELATAYEKVGDIQGDPYSASLGDTGSALASHRKSLAIRESLAAGGGAGDVRAELASSHGKLGDILWVTGDWKGALAAYEKARAIHQALAGDPSDAKAQYALLLDHQSIGDTLLEMGDLAGALDHQKQALQICSRIEGRSHEPLWRRRLATSEVKVADVLVRRGDVTPALESYRKAAATLEELSAADPNNAQLRTLLGNTYQRLGEGLRRNGEPLASLEVFGKGLALGERQLAADPTNAVLRRNLAGFHSTTCTALADAGRYGDAVDSCGKALGMAEALARSDPGNAQSRRDVAITQEEVARALLGGGRTAEAERASRKSVALAEAILAADATSAEARDDLFDAYQGLGRVLAATHRPDEALAAERKALALAEGLLAESPTNDDFRLGLAEIHFDLGRTCAAQAAQPTMEVAARRERWREAKGWFERSRDGYQQLRARGLLEAREAGRADEAGREAARSEQALLKLGPAS